MLIGAPDAPRLKDFYEQYGFKGLARALGDASAPAAKLAPVVAMPGVASKLEGIPENYEKLLAKNDLNWAAKNRERILAEWSKRYEGKAEGKP